MLAYFLFIYRIAICTIHPLFLCASFHQHLIDKTISIGYNKIQKETRTQDETMEGDRMKKNWNSYFPTEQDLLNALMTINASEKQYPYLVPCGYVYLQSFQKRIKSGKELTEKQMTQLKRLAYEIADKLEKQDKEAKRRKAVQNW